jgi:hypothetical protein
VGGNQVSVVQRGTRGFCRGTQRVHLQGEDLLVAALDLLVAFLQLGRQAVHLAFQLVQVLRDVLLVLVELRLQRGQFRLLGRHTAFRRLHLGKRRKDE